MSTSIDSLPPIAPQQPMGQGQQQQQPQQQFPGGQDPNAQYNPNMDFPANPPADQALDSTTVQELVRDLQEANSSGATSLPVRDIAQTTEAPTDEQVQPNYVPNRRVRFDDEGDDDNYEEISTKNAALRRRSQSYNSIYDELQIPILLAILYFIFQLPIVRLTLYKHLPMLYDAAGSQLNLIGLCMCSALFGFGYLFLSKIMAYLSSFW